jgi:hypothetical protein
MRELSVAEQRYQAVLAVIGEGLRSDISRLSQKPHFHPTASDLDAHHDTVKSACSDIAAVAGRVAASLKANTDALADVMQKASEVASGPVKDASPEIPTPAATAARVKRGKTAAAAPATPASAGEDKNT